MAEDVADNWEALDDVNELDKQLKKLEKSVKNTLPDEDTSQSKSNRSFISDPSITQFKPAFRILKRDSSQSQSSQVNSISSSKPLRTLEEREAAYAEARLRILGSTEQKSDCTILDNIGLVTNCSTPKKPLSEKTSVLQPGKDKKMLNNR